MKLIKLISVFISSCFLSACVTTPVVEEKVNLPQLKMRDKNIKPTSRSYEVLQKYLETTIKGEKLSANWCKDSAEYATEFFSPTKFEILGKPEADTFYNDKIGAYWNIYSVRVWSSNQGGVAIIKDWKISLKFAEKKYAPEDRYQWCLDYIYTKN
ncbi:hypothetical protein [Iodobacter sp.]|uniref:hypothetical protein n=1 Tax=Iodobacter sp. TaxID=1915058 RepID=UPI0025E70409|nr:hypothetical protein [Iodobacter sp.]